ncbi:MAG: glycosyltransferase [Gammaproteobacteria bacterium]|nr:glycosyltransferase [Gammaproteobacteria bacterium]
MNHPHKLSILVVSTSFPTTMNPVSGIFIKRLTDALAINNKLRVLAPAGRRNFDADNSNYPVDFFRYGMRSWQGLTHDPGGIPMAIKRQPLFWFVTPFFMASMFLAAMRASRDVDIIHANWTITGLICCLVGKLRHLPVLTTLRGSDVESISTSTLSRILAGLTIRLSIKTVTVSSKMLESLQQHFPNNAHCITHIPNGVNDVFFRIPLPTPEVRNIKLVAIGNLTPTKGVRDIIDAISTIKSSVTITIVGDGPERDNLENQARSLGLEDKITFLGACDPEKIPGILCAHDALILASHSEGRPNVVIEAMAAGRAVLASMLPGVRELIDDHKNGLLFPPGDAAAISKAIVYLCEEPKRILQFGISARKSIEDLELSWTSCANRYTQLYTQIMDGK